MRLLSALITAAGLGVGLLVLQRWVAETRTAAMILVAGWIVFVSLVAWFATRGRRSARRSAFATLTVIAAATAAIGYWTGVRDREVTESLVVAMRDAGAAERAMRLAPVSTSPASPDEPQDSSDPPATATPEPRTSASSAPTRTANPEPTPSGPVRLLAGSINGADGHAASGTATVVGEPDGDRRLTLSEFGADPGPNVEVYLARNETDVDDVIELGDLKGNVGDQQYKIPADADLGRYDTLILWCVPFTTRIAVASLR